MLRRVNAEGGRAIGVLRAAPPGAGVAAQIRRHGQGDGTTGRQREPDQDDEGKFSRLPQLVTSNEQLASDAVPADDAALIDKGFPAATAKVCVVSLQVVAAPVMVQVSA